MTDPTHRYLSSPERLERIEHHFGSPAILRKWKAGSTRPKHAIFWACDLAREYQRNAVRLAALGDCAGAERLNRIANDAADAAEAMQRMGARQAVAA